MTCQVAVFQVKNFNKTQTLFGGWKPFSDCWLFYEKEKIIKQIKSEPIPCGLPLWGFFMIHFAGLSIDSLLNYDFKDAPF